MIIQILLDIILYELINDIIEINTIETELIIERLTYFTYNIKYKNINE